MAGKVLVTGGTGFIGRHTLAPLIEKGYEVHATGRKQIDAPAAVTLHSVDLLDHNAQCALFDEVKPDYLLHFAWYVEPGKYVSSFINYAWQAATLHMLDQFKSTGGQRAVLAGTCFEYEFGEALLREDDSPATANTLYGQVKNALRQEVAAWSRNNDLPCAWGRIFYLYGPHEYEKRLVAAVINNLLLNQAAPCSEGNQIRDFMHVQDVANAFVAVLESEITGTINIASGVDDTIRDVVNMIGEFTGNTDQLDFGAFQPRPGDPESVLGDVTKLRETVGWSPNYDLRSGIEHTVTWWREQLASEKAL